MFTSSRRSLEFGLAAAASVLCSIALVAPSAASAATQEDKTQFGVTAGTLSFLATPGLPGLGTVTLNGKAQTTNAIMNAFEVADATGTGAGWNVTVEGQTGAGKSAVFAAYCAKAKCGTEAEGYVTGGATLPANSLTLNSTGATFEGQNGSTGTAPALQCAAACNVDSKTAVKVVSAAKEAGMGSWLTKGFTATNLALTTPSTLKTLPNEEIYRVNVMWTLSTGP